MAQEIKVDVHGPEISVSVRGTCLKTTYRKGDAPWLVCIELKTDDPQAVFTREQFRALASSAQAEVPPNDLPRLLLRLRRTHGVLG